MNKLILALFAIPMLALGQGATNDYIFYQKPASGPLVVRPVTPTAGRLMGWPTSISAPASITLGTGLSLSGSTLNATASSAWGDLTGVPAAITSWGAITRASGFDTFTATPSSANLAATVTDETGTGSLVFSTSPTLTAPRATSLQFTNGTNFGGFTGGTGGTLRLDGTNAVNGANGANGGTIYSIGGNSAADGGNGGGKGGNGGSIFSTGGAAVDGINGANGGFIYTYAGLKSSDGTAVGGAGGSINLAGGDAQNGGIAGAAGGSIDTSDGGGSINTRNTGSIEFGALGTRTTLVGSAATTDKTITMPNATGTILLTDGNGSALTSLNASNISSGSLALARIAQGGATSGQALAWDGTAWAPATVGGGLTIGTTAITGGTSGRLLTSGTTVGELTLGTGVSTFLGTPSLANFNTALSDADVATTGANTFTGLQQFSGTTHAGLRLNNLTTAERDAIAAPAAGMAVWNTTDGRLQLHNGSAWTSGMVRLSGDTMTGALTITQGTANTGILTSTGYSLTGSNATTMVDLAGTWNTSGTPTAIKLNITNTASNAASSLIDVQSGGTSRFKVLATGGTTLGGGASSPLSIVSSTGTVTFTATGDGSLLQDKSVILPATGYVRFGFVGSNDPIITGASSSLTISQITSFQLGANTATNGATATAQTIKGPNATGTTSTGGSLTLAGGTGTSAGGAVVITTAATTTQATAVTVSKDGVTTFAKPPVVPVYTVATLPATAAAGMVQGAHAIVTDATTPTYLGALTGGGAVVCPVFYNGTAWVSH